MNHPNLCLRAVFAAALALVVAATAIAQTTSTPTSTSTVRSLDAADEPVKLSPFNVITDRDVGFVASSSLAGGRLRTDLKDTPLAYSVITREFLDALNLFDSEEALAWSVGAYKPFTDVANYRYFNNETGSSIISRGIQTVRPQRNFFLLGVNTDNYSEERIDFARGPNALLIGTTGLGGSVIAMTKKPRHDRTYSAVTAVVGSWNKYRLSIDHNHAVNDKLALRVNLLMQEADTWRELEFDKRKGLHVSGSYRLTKRTTLRAEYEAYENNANVGRESMEDRVSGWDGISFVSAPIATITDSTAKGITRLGSSTAPYLVYIPGVDATTVTNFANTWTTVGGGASAGVPVAGVLPLSTANLGINGGNILGDIYDPATRLRLALGGSALIRPNRRTVTGPTTPTLTYKFDDVALYLEHQHGDHFFFEAGAHHAVTSKLSNYIAAREANEIFLDINQTLPTGGTNPNFRQPYFDALNSNQYFDNSYTEARAALAAVFDNTRFGDFRGNVIVGRTHSESLTYRTTDVFNRNSDIRRRSADDVYRYRYYFNNLGPLPTPQSITLVDPIASSSSTYPVDTIIDLNSTTNNRGSKTDYDYAQLALNAKLWKGRINLLAGARRDSYTQHDLSLIGSAAALFNDYPANWDGQTIIFRPSAPSDYWNLKYVPKNSAGVATGAAADALSRPRTNGVPQPQYASDRFRDDFAAPDVNFSIDTLTYGGVFHVLPWISAYGNYAETYIPPRSGLTLTGAAVPPGVGDGWDAGIRINFLNGRIVVSVGKYSGQQTNNSFDSSGTTRKYANIVAANVVGDFSANGTNKRGLPELPTPTFDFSDREASGFEIDLVANVTRNWRMIFNYSDPETFSTNSNKDQWAYLTAQEGTLRQIVLDAGGIIDATNVATVDTSVPVGNRSPDVAAAVTGWNDIQTFKRTSDRTAKSFSNVPAYTANFYNDYRFTQGRLKNIRIGAGIQLFGDRTIGNRGADTMVNPANTSQAIDDPNVDINTLIKMPSYYTVTATIGYEHRFRNKVLLNLNLSVGNLLDNDDLIFTGVALRPPGGDITRPDRVATPVAFNYRTPRSFTLSAKFTF